MIPFLRALFRRFALVQGRRQLPPSLAAGDVCSVRSGDGTTYSIAKVLARDPGIIHVRVYKEKFKWRPDRADTTHLSLGTIHDSDGVGVGHLPLSEGEFGLWEPIIIRREEVSVEELDGYDIWKESRGGVWQ